MNKRLAGMTCFGLAAMLATGSALAGSQAGKVVTVYVRQNDGLVFFTLDGPFNNRAACAASNNLWILPNENSETAKKQYAALLAAHASDLTVTVQGTGACTRWVNSEDADTIAY